MLPLLKILAAMDEVKCKPRTIRMRDVPCEVLAIINEAKYDILKNNPNRGHITDRDAIIKLLTQPQKS